MLLSTLKLLLLAATPFISAQATPSPAPTSAQAIITAESANPAQISAINSTLKSWHAASSDIMSAFDSVLPIGTDHAATDGKPWITDIEEFSSLRSFMNHAITVDGAATTGTDTAVVTRVKGVAAAAVSIVNGATQEWSNVTAPGNGTNGTLVSTTLGGAGQASSSEGMAVPTGRVDGVVAVVVAAAGLGVALL